MSSPVDLSLCFESSSVIFRPIAQAISALPMSSSLVSDASSFAGSLHPIDDRHTQGNPVPAVIGSM